MARTKADAGKKAGGKAPRKAPVLRNTPSSGGVTKRKSRSSAGSRNTVCKRAIPKWQVSVKDLEWGKAGSSKDAEAAVGKDAEAAVGKDAEAAVGKDAEAAEPELIDLEPNEVSSTSPSSSAAAGDASAASPEAGGASGDEDSEDNDESMDEENLDDKPMSEVGVNGGEEAEGDKLMNVDAATNQEVSTTNGFIKCGEKESSAEEEVDKEDPEENAEKADQKDDQVEQNDDKKPSDKADLEETKTLAEGSN